MIDLRSDTVTKPSPAMLSAMMKAQVGDDVFGEDPTINQFQDRMAELFGFESALFCSSGTMCNQIAIKVHCRPGDEVIASSLAHVFLYEGGGTASNAGASMKMKEGDRGRLSAEDVRSMINPDDAHFPKSTLVCLEDSMNKGGGACYDLEEIKKIRKICDEEGMSLHLDGARLFNALVKTGYDYKDYASSFDSISICFSKGLGCPVGSILLGSKKFIHQAHRIRKSFGGGMRQAGFLAAAGLYALDHHINRLKEDHSKAKTVESLLSNLPFVNGVLPVETNIVVFKVDDSEKVVKEFEKRGILIVPFGPDKARIVTHLDFSNKDLAEFEEVINNWNA